MGAEEGAGEEVAEGEEGGEVLDADAEGGAEEREGVFGDELFEGDEEGGFEGEEALDWVRAGGVSVSGNGSIDTGGVDRTGDQRVGGTGRGTHYSSVPTIACQTVYNPHVNRLGMTVTNSTNRANSRPP